MSPVSPVFHTAVTVNQIFSDQQHLTNKQFNSLPCVSLFIWEQDWAKKEFQIEVLTLIQ